jgi:hypothetical protein
MDNENRCQGVKLKTHVLMKPLESTTQPGGPEAKWLGGAYHRRNFLRIAGATAATGTLVLAGCSRDDDDMPSNGGLSFGTGDVRILNYAYALEQLEAAFYTQVAMSFFAGATDTEKALLTDIRNHEVAHREFFKAALGAAGATALPNLEVDFSSINFGDRASVLNTAKTFEDLGVAAYNGAGRYIENADYLTLAGKIVSVEARHAAFIRDLLSNGSFADNTVIDANGLEMSKAPRVVLAAAAPFIKTQLDPSTLPA